MAIEVYKKNTLALPIVIRSKTDMTAKDLTGFTIKFMLKKTESDADVDAIITKNITSHSDAAAGKSLLLLTAEEMNITAKTYVYEFRLQNADLSEVTTIAIDKMNVKDVVIKS